MPSGATVRFGHWVLGPAGEMGFSIGAAGRVSGRSAIRKTADRKRRMVRKEVELI